MSYVDSPMLETYPKKRTYSSSTLKDLLRVLMLLISELQLRIYSTSLLPLRF
jgi:hypothetical protein